MCRATDASAVIAFRNQIEAAFGTNSYWKEAVERGVRFYDKQPRSDVTAERYVEFCYKQSLARAILDAPPITLFLTPDFDTWDDDLD